MKAAECEDLRDGLLHKDEKKVEEAVRSKYAWVQYVTLMAIRSQEQLIPPCSICSNPSSRPSSCKVILLLLLFVFVLFWVNS
jgi:hypothetical protein